MKLTLVALNARYQHTNLAIRQMLPVLEGIDGLRTRFFEGHINVPYRAILERIAEDAPDVVGFSCYIWNIDLVLRLCRALRLALPGVRIALGGPEVSHRGDAPDEADFLLRGEGESALPLLMRQLMKGETPSRAIRASGLLDPADWPDPYARGIEGLENRILYIETSRGCPHRCAYCLSAAELGVRALSAEEAVLRLTRLADMGARLIKLVDRTFNFDPRRANAIWRGLIAHQKATGHAATYHFEVGGEALDAAALEALSRAPKGLFQFEAGIQSTDSGVLAGVRRTAGFQDVARGVRGVLALGTIHVHVDLIAGMPGDDNRSFARSFDDAFGLGAHMLQLGFLKLLHGSPLRADAGALGIRFEPDAPYEVIETPAMSFGELCHLKDVERVLDWYVNSGRYALPVRRLIGGGSAFALFSSIAAAFRRQGLFDAERAEKARAAALLAYHDTPEQRALITHSLLRAGMRRELPDALAFSESDEDRAALRERFRPVRGQSLARYDYDVEHYERTGEWIVRKTRVLYL